MLAGRPEICQGRAFDMQVLALVAPRDGIGRTTFVKRLALQVERAGEGPVVLLDADPSCELSNTCEGGERNPFVVKWDASCAGPAFHKLKTASRGLVLIDAPPPNDRSTLDQVLSVTDLVAVLVRPRDDDFNLLGGLLDAIETAGKPFVFIVNRAKKGGNMAAGTAIALAQYGPVCPIVLTEDERVAPSLRARVFRRNKPDPGELNRQECWSYISEQLKRRAQERNLAADGRERRQFPRHSYDIGATFTWERRVFPCRIQDISASGIAFTSDVPLPMGARLVVHIPYLGDFEAEPVRSDGRTVGLRFIIDEWQQAGLVRDLAGLVNNGRGPQTSGLRAAPSVEPEKEVGREAAQAPDAAGAPPPFEAARRSA